MAHAGGDAVMIGERFVEVVEGDEMPKISLYTERQFIDTMTRMGYRHGMRRDIISQRAMHVISINNRTFCSWPASGLFEYDKGFGERCYRTAVEILKRRA
jgi:hypothetical protein